MSGDLRQVPLFAALDEALLAGLGPVRRTYAPGATLCEEGAPGETLFVLVHGLANVYVQGREGPVDRARRGDVFGEMSLLTGEPRAATVRAVVATETLEVARERFLEVLGRQPALLGGVVRLVRERLLRSNRGVVRRRASALVHTAPAPILAAARALGGWSVLEADAHADLGALLDALAERDTLLVVHPTDPRLPSLLPAVDRVLAADTPGVRAPGPDPAADARYLLHARRGVALGAGGARGYAHAGVLQVLDERGLVVDGYAGSSIGGVVAACAAMGMSGAAIESAMRRVFTPDTVAALFRLSLGPTSPAHELWTRILRELTEDRTFADLPRPLTVMTVDLEAGVPWPVREGPLWEALLATTALPGMAPPVPRGDRRLADGLALVPVPTSSLDADLRIAVNLLGRDPLPAWPGEAPQPRARAANALDNLLEGLELSHAALAARHAADAELCVTPRFGPCTWKDFGRADGFVAAGRRAMETSLDGEGPR